MRCLAHFLFVCVLIGLAGCETATPPTTATMPAPLPTLTVAVPSPTAAADDRRTSILIPTEAPSRMRAVRLVHAVSGLPPVNIFAGQNAIATNLNFSQITDETPLDARATAITVRLAGATSHAMLESTLDLDESTAYVLALVGSPERLRLITIPYTPAPLNAGESAIAVINTLTDDRPLSLRAGDAVLLENIQPGDTSVTASMPAGDYTVDLFVGDSAPTAYPLTLRERFQETLLLAGSADNIAVVRWATRAPGRVSARIINASAQLSLADVYIGDQLAAQELAFGRAGSPINLVTGSYPIRIYPADADPDRVAPYLDQTVSLTEEAQIALVILGETNALRPLIFAEDMSPTPPDRARIAFLNTLPHVPVVQLETQGGPLPDIPRLVYGDAPLTTELAAGEWDVYWTGGDRASSSQPLEAALRLQLRTGFAYLYLVTGRLDNNPVILSQNVGIDETLTTADEELAPQMLERSARLRLVNALSSQEPVDVWVNDVLLASQLRYASTSPLTTLAQRSAVIAARFSDQPDRLAEIETALEAGAAYTAIVYGTAAETRLLILPDSDLTFDRTSAHVRFINTSLESDTVLGMGFSAPDNSGLEALDAPRLSMEGFGRRSIPAGVQRIVNSLSGGSASRTILMPFGLFDIDLFDPAAVQLVGAIPGVKFEAGAHYDIIAYQEADTDQVRAFLLRYPAGSG